MSNVQPGTVMVDRYRLTSPATTDLAEAEAWTAQDQILDRPVRVTFVTGSHASSAMDAARRAALVADPRLCRVLDVGSTDLGDGAGEKAYVITEPYAGESLTQIVSRGLVDAQQARAIVGEAASALDAARQRGVHHLALRPEAVRVDGHRVVVTGLGIDAGLAGVEASDVDTGATDARALVALGYYALTARWPGEPLDADWIAPDAVRPLPAQGDADGATPLSSLVPHVDPELDALARRTFGPGDDVPARPGDVVAALEPWGQVSVVAALPQFVQPVSDRPVRASVLGTGSTGESRPGTPPPAPPVRRPSTTGRIARAGAVGSVAGAAYGQAAPTTAYPPVGYGTPPGAPAAYGQQPAPQPASAQAAYAQQHAPVPAPPGGHTPPPSSASPTTGSFASTAAPRRRGVNPTPIVLGIILVLVVVAAIWAVAQASKPFDTTPPVAATSESAAPTDEATGDSESEPAEEETPEVRPIIDTGTVIALGDSEADYADVAEYAYDSDPATFWYTRTYYNNPVFGGYKEGLGFEIALREKAPVSAVELNTNSSGGRWELRSTTGEDPNGGDVLADGSFSDKTSIELDEPMIVDTMVLWITELPTSEGEFRLELNEITLS